VPSLSCGSRVNVTFSGLVEVPGQVLAASEGLEGALAPIGLSDRKFSDRCPHPTLELLHLRSEAIEFALGTPVIHEIQDQRLKAGG